VWDVDVPASATRVAAGVMVPGRQFGQTFVCKSDGLTRVEVMIATYTKSIPSGVLKLHLRSGPDQHGDLASAAVPVESIKDNSYVALDFPPIRDSGGKSYYVVLDAQNIPTGYGLTVYRSENDIYPGGEFYIDGQPQPPQDMCFRVASTH
jgi:hypothetical protein